MLTDQELRQAVSALDIIADRGDDEVLQLLLREANDATPAGDDWHGLTVGQQLGIGRVADELASLLGESRERCFTAALDIHGPGRKRLRFDALDPIRDRVDRPVCGTDRREYVPAVRRHSEAACSPRGTAAVNYPIRQGGCSVTDIRVSVGSPNGDGKRKITYRYGDREYPDTVNTDDGFQRGKSVGRGCFESFGLPTVEISTLDAEVARLAAEADKGNGDKRERRLVSISSAELAADTYMPDPIITSALYADVPAVIGALYKTCKSLVAIDGALSIATGRPFLNCWTVPAPRGVIYFSGEGGKTVARDYGERIAASKGITLADATNLRWCFSVPRLESFEDLDDFTRELDDTAAEVVFLDNLMLCLSGNDAGNVYKMGSVLGNVIRLCSKRKVTPVFVHHFKRTRAVDRFAPGDLGDLTQSGVAEVAGQWWLLTRQKDYDAECPGEHKLWFSIGGRITDSSIHVLDIEEGKVSDPGGRHWAVRVCAPDEARKNEAENREAAANAKREEREAADVRKVIQAMAALERQHPEGNVLTAIRDRSCIRGQRLDDAIAAAIDDGAVVPCEFQRSNHRTPTRGYQLNPEGTAE